MPVAVPTELPDVTTRRRARAPGEQSSLTRWADLPGVELLTADYKRHAYVPHWHDALTIALVAGGCMRIKLAGSSHFISPQNVIVLEPGKVHDGEAYDAVTGWDYRVFYLDMPFVESISMELDSRQGVKDMWKHAVIRDQATWSKLLQVHTALTSSPTLLERSSALFEGVADLLARATTERACTSLQESSSPVLDRAREYLHANWGVPVSLSNVAAVAGLSRFHFLRAFKKRYGLPPHAYQLQLRVHHAKELMFQGMPATDVALETGFHDQAHLSHTMRRFVGVAPGKIYER